MRYSKWNSVVEYVTNNLQKAIVEGDYAIGSRFLTEREICEQYSVGRSSAREALRILETTGWIKIIRSRGAFVARKTRDNYSVLKEWYSENAKDIEDIISLREIIEPSAAAIAAKVATPSAIEDLRRIFDALEEANSQHNVIGAIALDEEFHEALIDMIGNKYLTAFNRDIQSWCSFYRAKTYAIPEFFSLAQDEHRRIFEKIVAHDSETIRAEVENHIRNVRGYFRAILNETDAPMNSDIV